MTSRPPTTYTIATFSNNPISIPYTLVQVPVPIFLLESSPTLQHNIEPLLDISPQRSQSDPAHRISEQQITVTEGSTSIESRSASPEITIDILPSQQVNTETEVPRISVSSLLSPHPRTVNSTAPNYLPTASTNRSTDHLLSKAKAYDKVNMEGLEFEDISQWNIEVRIISPVFYPIMKTDIN